MGLNPSKRVHSTLSASDQFTAGCTSAFSSLAGQSSLLRPYQLLHASTLLHSSLLTLPLISRFAASPPSQFSVDTTYRKFIKQNNQSDGLDLDGFRGFGLELFTDAVMKGMGAEIAKKVPIGAVVVAGVGAAARVPAGVVGKVVGVYAAGVAATVFLGLG
ncbi:hypothetical protein LUZ60_004431 [Juncus effusus]|nr:hypothetical protein LUZ60_004431 [Juncus effusus]